MTGHSPESDIPDEVIVLENETQWVLDGPWTRESQYNGYFQICKPQAARSQAFESTNQKRVNSGMDSTSANHREKKKETKQFFIACSLTFWIAVR